MRFIIALTASNGWEVHHLDIKTSFFHGDIKETIYVTQPKGFEVKGHEDKVYKLHKALYGLKQASRALNEKLNNVLQALKFHRCHKEPSLCRKYEEGHMILVAVYVDDLIITVEFRENSRRVWRRSSR